MLTIRAAKGMTFDEMLEEYDIILSREIIECVCDAIDNDVPSVLIVEIIVPGMNVPIDICSSMSFYKNALQVNMIKMAELTEEYELCARAKKYIGILESQEDLENN